MREASLEWSKNSWKWSRGEWEDDLIGLKMKNSQNMCKEVQVFLVQHVFRFFPSQGSSLCCIQTCFDSSNFHKAQRVCHSQVPVQWYAAQERDADIDISIEDEAK